MIWHHCKVQNYINNFLVDNFITITTANSKKKKTMLYFWNELRIIWLHSKVKIWRMICLYFVIICWFLWFISGDVARVNGQLAVSRAFGDKNLKTHLRSDPDIQYADITPDVELLILASDGLWKVLIPNSPWILVNDYSMYLKIAFIAGNGKSRSCWYCKKNKGSTKGSQTTSHWGIEQRE